MNGYKFPNMFMYHVYTLYILPLPQDKVIAFLDGLSNEALKKEATSEARSETFSSIMKVLRGGG